MAGALANSPRKGAHAKTLRSLFAPPRVMDSTTCWPPSRQALCPLIRSVPPSDGDLNICSRSRIPPPEGDGGPKRDRTARPSVPLGPYSNHCRSGKFLSALPHHAPYGAGCTMVSPGSQRPLTPHSWRIAPVPSITNWTPITMTSSPISRTTTLSPVLPRTDMRWGASRSRGSVTAPTNRMLT